MFKSVHEEKKKPGKNESSVKNCDVVLNRDDNGSTRQFLFEVFNKYYSSYL